MGFAFAPGSGGASVVWGREAGGAPTEAVQGAAPGRDGTPCPTGARPGPVDARRRAVGEEATVGGPGADGTDEVERRVMGKQRKAAGRAGPEPTGPGAARAAALGLTLLAPLLLPGAETRAGQQEPAAPAPGTAQP